MNISITFFRLVFVYTISVITFILLVNVNIFAATITVINTNDTGAGSFRQAISDAAAGDTIDFNLAGCPCVINSRLGIDKNLIINGPGADQLTISGSNAGQVIAILNRSGAPSVTISGLTIANGSSTFGGGIYIEGRNPTTTAATVTITNSVITQNAATGASPNGSGGGIFVTGANLSIFNSTISNNTASTSGAGIGTLSINSTNKENITLVNCNLTNNTANTRGGGVFVGVNSTLTSSNSNFSNNSVISGMGAGIANYNSATISGGNINSNTLTVGTGGGIHNDDTATLSLTQVNVSNNTIGSNFEGGGIYSEGTLNIDKSTISGNSSGQSGGIHSQGNLTITDTTISGNTASNTIIPITGGGGITTLGNAAISNSTISGNTASSRGGGISNGGTLTLVNSTVSGNQVNNGQSGNAYGGGIHTDGNSISTLRNNTITLNSSALRGGGVGNFSFVGGAGPITVNVGNTIIAQNTIPNPNASSPDVFGIFITEGFNLISNRANQNVGFINGEKNDIVGTNVNMAINALLEPLANNGGLTQTHALQDGSPAIDKGINASGILTDQRGFARFVDKPNAANIPGGNNSDIGAFEVAVPTPAAVGVSGRILTFEKQSLRNALVILIDSHGNTRTVKTGSFGHFRFSDVEVGQIYVLLVRSKSFSFTPQIITVSETVNDLEFVAAP